MYYDLVRISNFNLSHLLRLAGVSEISVGARTNRAHGVLINVRFWSRAV